MTKAGPTACAASACRRRPPRPGGAWHGKITVGRLLRLGRAQDGDSGAWARSTSGPSVGALRARVRWSPRTSSSSGLDRDNLTLFDPRPGGERLLAVLGEVGPTAWIASLPRGLDTPLKGSEASRPARRSSSRCPGLSPIPPCGARRTASTSAR